MLRFSINRITNDYCQFLMVYSYDMFYDILSESLLSFFNIDELNSDDLNLNDSTILSTIKNTFMREASTINCDFYLIPSIVPKIEIKGNIKKGEEIIVIISCAVIDKSYELILPEDDEINSDSCPSEKDMKELIDYLLVRNRFCISKEVEEVSLTSDVYANVLGKDLLLRKGYNNPLIIKNNRNLLGAKIGDPIVDEGVKRKEIFNLKISKIIDNTPLELSDEIVLKIKYMKNKNVDSFKKQIEKDYLRIMNFNQNINLIYELINKKNKIKISKYVLKLFNDSISKSSLSSFSTEEKYDLIKSLIIKAYLQLYFFNDDGEDILDTSWLNGYFKCEYRFFKLLKQDICDTFEEYLDIRKNDANLYTIIRGGMK